MKVLYKLYCFLLCRMSSILQIRYIVCGYLMVNYKFCLNVKALIQKICYQCISNLLLSIDEMEFIPHFKKVVTMEPTAGLSVYNEFQDQGTWLVASINWTTASYLVKCIWILTIIVYVQFSYIQRSNVHGNSNWWYIIIICL